MPECSGAARVRFLEPYEAAWLQAWQTYRSRPSMLLCEDERGIHRVNPRIRWQDICVFTALTYKFAHPTFEYEPRNLTGIFWRFYCYFSAIPINFRHSASVGPGPNTFRRVPETRVRTFLPAIASRDSRPTFPPHIFRGSRAIANNCDGPSPRVSEVPSGVAYWPCLRFLSLDFRL